MDFGTPQFQGRTWSLYSKFLQIMDAFAIIRVTCHIKCSLLRTLHFTVTWPFIYKPVAMNNYQVSNLKPFTVIMSVQIIILCVLHVTWTFLWISLLDLSNNSLLIWAYVTFCSSHAIFAVRFININLILLFFNLIHHGVPLFPFSIVQLFLIIIIFFKLITFNSFLNPVSLLWFQQTIYPYIIRQAMFVL